MAQIISSVVLEARADGKTIVITGSGFSAADEVTVGGIPLEKISLTSSRIEAVLPKGIRLVGGEYVVKVTGKESARGSLRLSSESMPSTNGAVR